MLAELAIANAAFAIIKETINNGGDIMSAGSHIFSFFDSKADLAKKANKYLHFLKQNGPLIFKSVGSSVLRA